MATVTRIMSSDHLSHSRTKSSSNKQSAHTRTHTPPPSSLTPENTEQAFESCAATGSFFLYAQRNVILVLHHDTLAIERRFELHREDVKWITVDNVSERGAGRLAASYDAGHSTIVWDILTGREVARFAAYEEINTAQFMRNGNIAFGKDRKLTITLAGWNADLRDRQHTGHRNFIRTIHSREYLRKNHIRPHHFDRPFC